MKHDLSLEYQGIKLRQLAEDDIEQLRRWRNDEANSKYIRKLPYITEEAQREWFARYLEDETEYAFAICDGDCLLGSVSLYDPEEDCIEFGKLMIGDAKGKGLGTKATRAALELAFGALGYANVKAEVSVDNTAALIIYIRIGFCVTGRRYNELAQMDEFTLEIDEDRFKNLNGPCTR